MWTACPWGGSWGCEGTWRANQRIQPSTGPNQAAACAHLAGIHGADQIFAEPQRVQAEVDLDGHIDDVQRSKLLVFVACKRK